MDAVGGLLIIGFFIIVLSPIWAVVIMGLLTPITIAVLIPVLTVAWIARLLERK